MTIKEIYQREKENTETIFLYREGLFWKAYERSAWFFLQQVFTYEVKAKYYKAVGATVASLGFPATVLEKRLEGHDVAERNPAFIAVLCSRVTGKAGFEAWRRQLDTVGNEKSVLETIRMFPIATSTPVECMMFVSQLQEMVLEK